MPLFQSDNVYTIESSQNTHMTLEAEEEATMSNARRKTIQVKAEGGKREKWDGKEGEAKEPLNLLLMSHFVTVKWSEENEIPSN